MDQALPESLLACLQQALGHELPNQLVALRGLARLLEAEEGERLGPDGRAALGRVGDAARRTHDLVAALAELVRLERDPTPPGRVDLAEAVAEAAAEVKLLCPSAAVLYDDPRPARLVAAPSLAVRQVLVALLKLVAREGPCRVEVRPNADGTSVSLWLAATGLPATPPKERLFEPFALAWGTGLELFAARRRAEAWGGSLRLEPVPGGGDMFVLTAPPAEP